MVHLNAVDVIEEQSWGHFKDDNMHGKGQYHFADGRNYTGGWIDDKRTGFGVLTWPNGDRYEGHFNVNELHGIGKMNFANGQIKEGMCWNNTFVG